MVRRARRPATSPNRTKSRTGPEALGASGLGSLLLSVSFHSSHRKVYFSIFHGHAKRNFRASGVAQLRDLIFHQRRKPWKGTTSSPI